MKEIPRAEQTGVLRWNENGHWFTVRRADGSTGLMLNCPDCGQTVSLADHSVDPIGAVTPSVVCPQDGCGFHEYVRLVAWASGVAGDQSGART